MINERVHTHIGNNRTKEKKATVWNRKGRKAHFTDLHPGTKEWDKGREEANKWTPSNKD